MGRPVVGAGHSTGSGALLPALCLLLAGCASEPVVIQAGPPPDVEFSPVLELLSDATSNDQVETLIDRDGRAHVIIAAKGTREIHHVIISPGGAVEREVIKSGPSPWAVSAAFDAAGRLHVLLDEQHFVQEASGWNAVKSTPWDGSAARASAAATTSASKPSTSSWWRWTASIPTRASS